MLGFRVALHLPTRANGSCRQWLPAPARALGMAQASRDLPAGSQPPAWPGPNVPLRMLQLGYSNINPVTLLLLPVGCPLLIVAVTIIVLPTFGILSLGLTSKILNSSCITKRNS